jgi:hypothetical protein
MLSLMLMFSVMLTIACTGYSPPDCDNSDIVVVSLDDQTDAVFFEKSYMPVFTYVEIHITKETPETVEEKAMALPVVNLLSCQTLDVRLCDIGSINKFSLIKDRHVKTITKFLFGYSMIN